MYNGEEICGGFAYYDADEVDAAIAELKEALHESENARYEAGADAVIEIEAKDAAIAELKAENDRLKEALHRLSCNADCCYRVQFKSTKRALWLARAERAHLKVLEYWPDYCHNAHCRIAEQKWDKVERKCRAKAEQYQ
jgi:hypothetical protein